MRQYNYGFIGPVYQWVLMLAMMSMATGLARADGLGPLLGDYVFGPGGTDQAWSVWVGGNFKTTGVSGKLQGRAFIRGNFTAESSLYNGYQIGNVAGGSNVLCRSRCPAYQPEC